MPGTFCVGLRTKAEKLRNSVPGTDGDAYFWATHQGAELDLLVFHRGRRLGFEVKFSDAPGLTKSMRVAHDDLELDTLWVVYPGDISWPMAERIEAVAFADLLTRLDEI